MLFRRCRFLALTWWGMFFLRSKRQFHFEIYPLITAYVCFVESRCVYKISLPLDPLIAGVSPLSFVYVDLNKNLFVNVLIKKWSYKNNEQNCVTTWNRLKLITFPNSMCFFTYLMNVFSTSFCFRVRQSLCFLLFVPSESFPYCCFSIAHVIFDQYQIQCYS